MKNFFKLEVFRDFNLMVSDKPETTSVKIYENMVPSIIFADVVMQWTAIDQDYRIKITFSNGTTITSDEIISAKTSSENIFNADYATLIRQEIINQVV